MGLPVRIFVEAGVEVPLVRDAGVVEQLFENQDETQPAVVFRQYPGTGAGIPREPGVLHQICITIRAVGPQVQVRKEQADET